MASEQTPQEAISGFERVYVERMRALGDLKDQLTKLQEQVISGHDAVFKAYQQLTNYKEQYLVTLINSKQNQINTLTAPQQVLQAPSVVVPDAQQRQDNL